MTGSRLEDLRASLDGRGLGCFVINKLENIRYITGFSGSNAVLVVTGSSAVLITDGRYTEQAAREAAGFELTIHSGPAAAAVAELLPQDATSGFEVSCTFNFYSRLTKAAEGRTLQPVEGVVEELRVIKDAGEIQLIRQAMACASTGFEDAHGRLQPGSTEREGAAELDYRMMLAGADGPAFDTVVASGPNSALPHAPVTDRALSPGDLVVVDFGAEKAGYRSDTTRTLTIGDVGPRASAALDAVRGALEAAMSALEPGIQASAVDAVAREYISERGFGREFNHSLGHGVGLETHERPTLSSVSSDRLEPGMVFTVEPGVYLEGFGGVRLEELVLMTEAGPEVLSGDVFLADS